MRLHKSNRTLIAGITTMSAVMVGGLVGFAALSDILTPASAEAATSTVISGGYNLSISTSGEVSMALNPTSGGSFVMSKETLNTKTNANGYSLYIGMQGPSNNLYLNDDTSSTPLSSMHSSYTYTNPGTITTNSWGYAIPQSSTMPINGGTLINDNLASGNGFSTGTYVDNSTSESDTKWASVPVKGSEQIIQNTNSANDSTGVDLNVFYGVKANSSQAIGAYKGTIVYTAIAKGSNTSIASVSPTSTEKMNGGEELTITISNNSTQYSSLTTKNITIGSDTCTVTGGGNTSGSLYLTCTAPAKTQSGFYDINVDLGTYGTYTIADGIEYTYKEPSFFEVEYMQDFTSKTCKTVKTPLASVKTVTSDDGSDYADDGTNATIVPSTKIKDKRDEQEYTIRKLADGNCWMTENLRYGINPDGTGHPWVAADADLTDNPNATKMADLTYNASSPNTGGRIKNGSSGMKTANGSYSAFYSSGDSYTEPYINIYNANTVATYDGKTKYGVQYNYCAATGGTVCNTDSMSEDATSSICPRGWKLPGMTDSATGSDATTDGSVKSYNNLANSYGYSNTSLGLTGMLSSPINLVRAGNARNGSLGYRSSSGRGYYWASTRYTSNTFAYHLYLYDNYGNYVYKVNDFRYDGCSVRCVSASS